MRAPRETPAVTRGSDALLTTSTRFPVEPVTAAPRPACKSVSTGSLARKAVRCEVVCGPGSKPADSWPRTGACPTPLRLSLRFFRTAQQNSIAQWTFVTDSVAPALPTRDLRPDQNCRSTRMLWAFAKPTWARTVLGEVALFLPYGTRSWRGAVQALQAHRFFPRLLHDLDRGTFIPSICTLSEDGSISSFQSIFQAGRKRPEKPTVAGRPGFAGQDSVTWLLSALWEAQKSC